MAQPVWYIERDLFDNAGDWISNKGDNINKPPSDYFEASLVTPSSTMMVTNGSLQAWGGALVSRKRGVPVSNGKKLNWLALRLQFKFPSSTAQNTARLETDWKVCFKTRPNSQTKIRNVANFSTQWNADSGQFQIDLDPPAWVDTGFVISEITPDVWHTLEYRFTFDETAQTFSVLSIQYDDQLYVIPENLQHVPAQLTNWEEVSSHQIQDEVYGAKSTVLVEYRDGIAAWSDQRITQIPPEALRRAGLEREYWWPRIKGADQHLVGGTFDPFGPDADCEPRRKSSGDQRE